MTNQRQTRVLTKSTRKRVNTALFKAVRADNATGVRSAVANGADLRVISRGFTALERAMRDFPRSWEASVVACLMEATSAIPEHDRRYGDLLVRGFALAGEVRALQALLDSCVWEGEQFQMLLHIKMVLLSHGETVNPDVAGRVAHLIFSDASEVEERTGNLATWLHVAVCGTANTSLEFVKHGTVGTENPSFLEHMLGLTPKVDVPWFGYSPLHLAAHLGRDASFDRLLGAGADVDLPDGNGELLHSAYGLITQHQWARVEAMRLQKLLESTVPTSLPTRRARM